VLTAFQFINISIWNFWRLKQSTERQKDRKIERQNDRKIERQKDRKTERQKDRKTERHMTGIIYAIE
jgi:hypothetical protein